MASRRIGSFLINPGNSNATQFITTLNDGAGSGFDADLLDGQHGSYYAPKASPAFTGTPTAPTASAGTNTTQLATTAFVSTAVSNLVDSAPGTLDTLNELAAALGDDSNFSTTVTNSIATKLSLSGGTMTGNIAFSGAQTVDGRDLSADGSKLDGIAAGAEVNVQSDWNATSGDALILNKPTIPTNNNQLTNGAGYITSSGSITGSAGTLDGIDSSQFLRSDTADTAAGVITFTGRPIVNTGATENGIRFRGASLDFVGRYSNYVSLFNQSNTSREIRIPDSGDVTIGGNAVWHAGNDGAGSGLDADLLDGQQGSYYLNYNNLSNTPTIPTNNNQLTNGAGYITSSGSITGSAGTLDGIDSTQFLRSDTADTATGTITFDSGANVVINSNIGANSTTAFASMTGRLEFDTDYSDTARGANKILLYYDSNAWMAGFGVHNSTVSYYSGADHAWYKSNSSTSFTERMRISSAGLLTVGGNTVWNAGNDGSGSGLDADLLDGQQGSYYLDYNNFTNTPASAAAPNNGTLTLNVSGGGLSGSASFTANQSGNSTFTVTSNATSANTASTIVARDGSGNFSAGTITAALSGNAATATNISGYSGTYWTSNNDGAGSGLDADLLDGLSSGSFFRADASNGVDCRLTAGDGRGLRFWDSDSYKIWMSHSGNATWGGRLDSTSDYNMYFRMTGGTNRGFVFKNSTTNVFQIESNGQVRLASNNIYAGNANIVWHAGNDGAGSGLDADLLDGISSASFLRGDVDDTFTRLSGTRVSCGFDSGNDNSVGCSNWFRSSGSTGWYNQTYAGGWYMSDTTWIRTYNNKSIYHNTGILRTDGTLQVGNAGATLNAPNGGTVTISGSTAWHAGNDGSGSGLDADTLDGVDSTQFLRSDANDTFSGTLTGSAMLQMTNTNAVGTNDAAIWCSGVSGAILLDSVGQKRISWNDGGGNFNIRTNAHFSSSADRYVTGGGGACDIEFTGDTANGAISFKVASTGTAGNAITWARDLVLNTTQFQIDGNNIWHAGNDGSGSGLDADLLDGLNAATTGANTIVRTDASGNIAASGNVTAYSSDRRLKENFNHIESPVEKVQKLNGYTFDWNEKSKELGFTPKHEKNDIGLIAQEVEDILPQAVAPAPFDTKSNGESKSGENYLTIQYERLVPLLVEAIKEQQNQINKLTQEIEQLKK